MKKEDIAFVKDLMDDMGIEASKRYKISQIAELVGVDRKALAKEFGPKVRGVDAVIFSLKHTSDDGETDVEPKEKPIIEVVEDLSIIEEINSGKGPEWAEYGRKATRCILDAMEKRWSKLDLFAKLSSANYQKLAGSKTVGRLWNQYSFADENILPLVVVGHLAPIVKMKADIQSCIGRQSVFRYTYDGEGISLRPQELDCKDPRRETQVIPMGRYRLLSEPNHGEYITLSLIDEDHMH